MPIPDFDQLGLLPAGVHDCTWAEIEHALCWNDRRQALFVKLMAFIDQAWVPLNATCPIFVDGSFVRRKDTPGDIDLVVDATHLPPAPLGSVFVLMTQQQRLKATFEVDLWMRHPGIPNDLTQFFQYAGVKAAAELQINSQTPKGILRVAP